MNKFGVMAGGLTLLFAAGAASTANANPRNTSWNKYEILIRNNMFLRDRSAPASAQTAVLSEDQTVLTGIALEGDKPVAFLEDTKTRATSKLREGDATCDGKIKKVAPDYIEYEKGGVTVRIEIGKNLQGTAAALPSASSAPGAEKASSNGAASASPESEAATIERMRQRRQKELER